MTVSKLVFNERTKLLAGALNTVATSSCAIGVLSLLAASFYAVPGSTHVGVTTVVGGCAVWLFAAFALHTSARYVLGRLRDD